jgi:hypothetical protein
MDDRSINIESHGDTVIDSVHEEPSQSVYTLYFILYTLRGAS